MSASAQILKKKKKAVSCLSWDAQHNKRFLRVVPDLWTLLKNLIPQHVSSLGSDVGEGWEAVFNKTTGFASAFLAPCGRRGSPAWPIGVLVLSWSQMTRQRLQGLDTLAILLSSLSSWTHKNQYEEVFSNPTLLLWGFQKELIMGFRTLMNSQWHWALGLCGDGDIPSCAAHYENISIPCVTTEHSD